MKSLSLRGSVAAWQRGTIFPKRKWRQEGRNRVSEAVAGILLQSQIGSRDKSCDSLKLPASGEPAGPLGTCGKGNEDDKPSAGTPAPARSPGHAARTRLHSDQTSIEPGVHDTLARDCESWSRHPERGLFLLPPGIQGGPNETTRRDMFHTHSCEVCT